MKLVLLFLIVFSLPLEAQENDPFETAGLRNRQASTGNVIGLQDDNSAFRDSPFAWNFFSLISMDGKTMKESNPQVASYNYLGLNYRLNQDEQLSIRPAFLYNSPGKNSFGDYDEGGLELHDIYLQYAHFNALNLPGGISTIAQYRWFLPTGEGSRERKTFGRAAGWFIFNRSLPRSFQLNYHVRPEYYFQSRRASISRFEYSDGTPGANVRGTQQFEFFHYLELGKILNQTWAITSVLGQTYQKYYGSESNDVEEFRRETINIGFNLRYNFSPRINFIFSVRNDLLTTGRKTPMKLGRDEEMNYALLSFIRL